MSRNKYGAHKTTVDGIQFASLREAARWRELRLMEQAGMITNLKPHPRYLLLEGFTTRDGERVRPITYSADFEYQEAGRTVTEEIKGGKATRTQAYELRRKMFLWRYPDNIYRVLEER